MPDVLQNPPRLPLIAPSILSADFANMERECRTVLSDRAGGDAGPEGGDLLHLDVMDGHFVPNLTMGPDMCRAIRAALPDVGLDVHLMVTDPQHYVEAFAAAGADHFTFHIEPAIGIYKSKGQPEGPPRFDAMELVDRAHEAGMTCGVAINPLTPPDALLEILPKIEMALVMSIHPGFSGQKFINATLETTRAIRAMLRADQRLEMDGGVSPANAEQVRDAGCDVLVAASAIFGKPEKDRLSVVQALRGASESARTASR